MKDRNIATVIYLMVMILAPWSVDAHQPNVSSTLLIEEEENSWVLQVRAALTAFEFEVERHFGASSYATPEEFQQLVINHVRENTSIRFNGYATDVMMIGGMVKLGHETSVTFKVVGVPSDIESVQIKNVSFADISRNQSALIVYKDGFARDQFILSDDNEHKVQLEVGDNKFMLSTPTERKAKVKILLLLAAGALLLWKAIASWNYFGPGRRKFSLLLSKN